MANDVATFRLEFSWELLCEPWKQGQRAGRPPEVAGLETPLNRARCRIKGAPYTLEEDELLTQLREESGLPWKEIHRQFAEAFHGTRQVRYYTKLKGS